MANRYDIIHIDFQASARGANAAIESIRQEADKCNTRISELKKNIAEAPKGTDTKILEGWDQELKVAERRYRQLTQAQKELMKGMRALDEGVKMFNDGSLQEMNAAFQKTVNNAAKLAQSKLTTGSKEWRQMGALMQETEQNYARMMRDTDQLIESLQNGGVVFRKTLEDEKKGLQDLLQVLPYMGTEYRKAEEQLQFLVKTTDEMAIKERQLKGEIVTTDDARRVSLQLTKEGADAARQRAAAADQEIEKGKQEIEMLETEREAREANARASAQAAAKYREDQQMYEDEIDRLKREIKAEEERAASGKTGVEAMYRKAEAAGKAADKELEAQKKLDAEYETAKSKAAALREEVEKLKQAAGSTPTKDSAAETVKKGAEEASAAIKQEAEAKKEEAKAGEEAAETNKKEAETAETLKKKHEGLVEETRNLITERDKLTKERDGLVETLEAEAAAAEKAANAFASLSKEEAEAMLKERQATITKGDDGKFSYTNAENAQHFLIESMRQVNPANAKGDALSLDSAGVTKVRAMFKERFGLQSDDDTKEAIKGLLADGENSLIKMGVMNNAFARIDLNTSKVTAYSKIIKDLTEVINGEVKAIEGESEAKKRLEQVDTRLLELDEKIDANDKASREIFQQRRTMMGSTASATETLTEKTDELSESKRKNVEATNAQIEAIKKMSAEEAKAASKAMTDVSTVGFKANKLDMSNPEEVQSWLITQMIKRGASVSQDGTLSVGGPNINGILDSFKKRYQLKGDNQKAKQLFKEVIQGEGGGGLLREGGVVDFSAETLMIKANTEAYQGRLDKLKALFEITNKASWAAAHSTETTERGTQAVKDATEATKNQTAAEQKALEVKKLKDAYDKSQAEYDKMKEHLAGLKRKKSSLPGGIDGDLQRRSLEEEIKNYEENVKSPKGGEVRRLKGQWQRAAAKLAEMQAGETAAQNQDTEATERNTQAKGRKAKASEAAAKATKEETQQSAELIAKEKELKDAEEAEATAKKNAEAQQKKTNKAVEDAETAADKAKQSEADLVKSLDEKGQKLKENKEGLEKLNEANKDTIATNEKNQQLLAETNNKIREQGEKIRDAERIKAQAKTEGIEKTEQSIRLLTEENRHIDQNSFTWKRNTIEIQHLQEALDEMKGKPALMMMEQRMKNIGALSASALEETRRFWDAMVQGAENGSEKLAAAEANVKALVEEERKRSEEKASKVIGNMGNFSDKEISDAVRTFEQLRDAQTHGNEEWTKFNNLVQQGKQHIEELAKQDALTKMEANMSNLTTLSDAARAETKKFFETLQAGAEKGSEELTKAETHLKAIKDLEKGENEAKAQKLLTGTLSNFSESEIREYIDAAQAFRKELASGDPAAQRYADAIAKAEAHVKKYGVEAARAAQQQADSNKLMRDQLNRIISDKQFGIAMPTASQLKAQKQYWQRLIDDPKTAATSLQQFRDRLAEVEQLEKEMVEINGKTALQWFGDGKDRDANGNQIKEYADKLKEYRGTLLQETNAAEIQQIDDILQRIGASAKKASEELMDFEKAKELALQAGNDVYGKNNPAFLASPEEIQAATKSIEKYREELFKTIKQKKDMGEATDAEEAELQELAKYMKDLKFEQDNFNMSREKMEALMKTPVNATNIDELRSAIKRADVELKRMEGSLGQNNAQYKAFAEQVRNAKNQLKEMEGQAKASATAWEKAWSRLKTYVVMYMGFNAAWQKITGVASDLMELSDKMGEVQKTTYMSADAVGRLTENLKKMDVRTGLVQLEELAASAGQLGLKSEEDILGFTEAANKLMIALPEMGREAATEMMRVAIATGEVKKIEDQLQAGTIEGSSATAVAMEKIASTIDRLRASSASTAPEITDFVKRMGAVGAQSGITIDQVAALGSTISSLGMRVEMSATALSRMVPAIKNNAFAIGKIIGQTETQIKEKFEKGEGMSVILDVFKAIRGNVDITTEDIINNTDKLAEAADKVEEMFGGSMKEIMAELNQQGARAGIVFAGLSQNVEELEKQLRTASEAYKENTAIQKEFDRMNETTAAKWERLKNVIEEWFLSDSWQRGLGKIIDGLRSLVDWFSSDGVLASGFKMMLAYVLALKAGFGSFFTGVGQGFGVMKTALGAGLNVFSVAAGTVINKLTGMTTAMSGLTKATAGARTKWKELNATMKANVIGAVIAALGLLALKLWNIHEAAKEAAAETGRFNQKVADEQRALNNLFEQLNKSNLAQEERSRLIKDINQQYGKYLGYMLSEYSSAMQLADAHALIAKRIKEEAYERRLAEQERKIYEKHDEDVNAAYGGIESAVRGGAKNGTDIQSVADMLKDFVDKNMDAIVESGKTLPKGFVEQIDGMTERLIQDGKLTRQGASEARTAMFKYLDAAKEQAVELKNATSGIRSDLRTINKSIQTDLTNNLNNLVGNIASFAKQQAPQPTPSPVAPQDNSYRTPWQGGSNSQQGGFGMFSFGGSRQQQQSVQRAPVGWKPKLNEKDVEEVRQFVDNQKNLRSMLQSDAMNMEQSAREIYESWKVSDEEMERLQKIITKHDRANGGGGGGNNPYGHYDVMDGYDKWDADALVKRKKQMLDYVRAMANGADVQAILAQDKKFMDDATRKGIKDVRQAIEWYNTERLKIQEELANRHLTNEGNWANPSKANGRKKRQVYSEEAVAELDRYYAWRKEEIERQRAEEGISEAEYNRRIEVMEQEHLERRSKLRWTFTNNATEAEKQEVEQFWKWWKSVKELDQDIDRELINAEWKVATAREKAYNNRDAQRDLTAMNALVIKHMKAIEDIINKERPFNGITDNLEKNLTDMGILFADFNKKRTELLEKGESTEEIDKLYGTDRAKRLTFILEQSEEAFTMTWEELMKRMADAGMQAWADEIQANPMMQQAVLAEMRRTYDEIQNAIKKEATQIKKEVDIWWNDLMPGQDTSRKGGFEKLLSQLGLAEDQVKRANQLIGAGAASERVADKLAIKQMQIRLSMQQTYYNRMRQIGEMRIQQLKDAAKLDRERGKMEEAKRKEQDAEHLTRSLNLSLSEEQKKLDEQRVAIANQLEESQNRLYTSMKEWGDLLASSMKELFEASNAGNAEYYNERAKMQLTGKGGPGAGTYIVIDDEGTEDARAHYEYLNERQALEREHEIEVQNAQADAWRKVMDDLNAKMNDQITDWINAQLQNQAVNDNTAALVENTETDRSQMEVMREQDGVIEFNTDATRLNTDALGRLTDELAQGITIRKDDGSSTTNLTNDTNNGGGTSTNPTNGGGEQSVMFQDGATPGVSWLLSDDQLAAEQSQINQRVQMQIDGIDKVRAANESSFRQIGKTEGETDTKMIKSSKTSFAAMTAAANMYGIAYQTMANDNLTTAQKVEMMIVQAAGQAAISMLTANLAASTGDTAANAPSWISKTLAQMGPYAGPIAVGVFTALIGGLMGLASSKVSKSKSQIAQATGASAAAGRLATGMMTYAEGNVNEFSDPSSLTPGRSYNVDGADGRTYRAKYMGKGAKTHITNGPEFHLVGEKGQEAIIDAHTTRNIRLNEPEIWRSIQTLYNGGRLSSPRRMGRGVRAFADGNIDEFENAYETHDTNGTYGNVGFSAEQAAAFQSSLDRNNELLERALNDGIHARFDVYGKGGLIDSYDTGKKTVQRHGERY